MCSFEIDISDVKIQCMHNRQEMFRVGSRLLVGKRPGKAPTVTVSSGLAGAGRLQTAATVEAAKIVRPERIIRPITEEEENYELMRVKKNAGANLRMKAKQSIAAGRRTSEKRFEGYDQI